MHSQHQIQKECSVILTSTQHKSRQSSSRILIKLIMSCCANSALISTISVKVYTASSNGKCFQNATLPNHTEKTQPADRNILEHTQHCEMLQSTHHKSRQRSIPGILKQKSESCYNTSGYIPQIAMDSLHLYPIFLQLWDPIMECKVSYMCFSCGLPSR